MPIAYTVAWPQVFDIPVDSCLRTSAKTGYGLEEVLPAVIARIPPPRSAPHAHEGDRLRLN